MKKIIALSLLSFAFLGCSNSAPQISQQPVANNNSRPSEMVAAHTTENRQLQTTPVTKSEGKSRWTQSGDPIDTSGFDKEIAEAEKKLKANPNEEAAKKALAEAYYQRGFALTEARQYASAIGDFRRVLKYDPENADAKKWIGTIVGIYDSINRDYPKEGEEPPPLPYKKES